MTREKASTEVTIRAFSRPAANYSRREALVALLAVPIALAADTSSASDAADYPVWALKGGRSLVYVLGHTPPRPMDWNDLRIESLLHTCGSLWNETNQTDNTDAQGLMQRYGIDPAKPLDSWLSSSDRNSLSRAAKLAGVPEDALQTFRPWLAGQALEGAFFGAKGFNGRNADAVLVSEASKAGLSVSSEFARKEDAARWFADLSPTQEVQYLRYVMDEILAGHVEGQRIYSDWARGKDAHAVDWVARMKQHYPELYRYIVVARNEGWVPRIRSIIVQPKPTMIVVGLYHLVGPDSIQAQLRANGLQVKRV